MLSGDGRRLVLLLITQFACQRSGTADDGAALVAADQAGSVVHTAVDIQPGWPRQEPTRETPELIARRSEGIRDFYRDAYLELFARERLRWSTDGDGGVRRLGELAGASRPFEAVFQQGFRYAALAIYVGDEFEQPELVSLGRRLYQVLAAALMRSVPEELRTQFSRSQGCFFATWTGALTLHRKGLLDDELRGDLLELAKLRWANCRPDWVLRRASHTHAIQPIISYVAIDEIFRGDAGFDPLRRYLERYWTIVLEEWQDWVEISHHGEQSLAQLVNPVLSTSQADRLKNDNWRTTFRRWRDHISPTGFKIASGRDGGYGDSRNLTATLEIGAGLLDDPTLAYAARKRALASFRVDDAFSGYIVRHVVDLDHADAAPIPEAGWAVVHPTRFLRLDRQPERGKHALKILPGLLVLRTGAGPGSAMVQMQLARGEQDSGHTRPEVSFFEANGTIFCARDPFDARASNLVLTAKPFGSFFDRPNSERFDSGWMVKESPDLDYGEAMAVGRRAGALYDAFGTIEFTRYIEADSTLTRRLVLTAEGMLVIVDRFVPGRSLDGYSGGSLWKLDAVDERGENWFNQPVIHAFKPQRDDVDGRRWAAELLVYHALVPGRETGLHDWSQQEGKRPSFRYTTFSKETLREDRPVIFVTVLVPHPERIGAGEIAAGITARIDPEGAATVTIDRRDAGEGVRVAVRVGNDGAWSVERESIEGSKNVRPSVRITSPADGVTARGTPFEITADAHDPDGEIDRVVFYLNGVKIGEDREAPYAFQVKKQHKAPGSKMRGDLFSVVAKAYDDGGAVAAHVTAFAGPRRRDKKLTVTAKNDRHSVQTGHAAWLYVLENDTLPGERQQRPQARIVSVSEAAHGKVEVAGRGLILRYTPKAGFTGPDRFTYTVRAVDGSTSTAAVAVRVR